MTDINRPLIAILGTGGTMSTIADGPLDHVEYLETGRKIGADAVIERLGTHLGWARVMPVRFAAVSSSAVSPATWIDLARRIEALCAEHPDLTGIVILHGTATLEETAYFLHLVLDVSVPVIVTGAQRPIGTVGSDAGINFLSAVRTAADPQAAGKGVCVVFEGEIHCARDVSKTATYRIDAFHSAELGPIGLADPDRVVFYRSPERRHTGSTPFRLHRLDPLPRVDIAYAYAGADGRAVAAFQEAGARGIVSAGFAPGITTPAERGALEAAAASGIVIAQTTRAGSGRIARRRYLREAGMVACDNLNPQKARILLGVGLAHSTDPDEIQTFFDQY